jgi:7-carboxy-7-deazaguanine synthase
MEKGMRIYNIFQSINGEVSGFHQGLITTFIRFSGCNCRCRYCDTKYALNLNTGEEMGVEQILEKVGRIGCKNITITGGEPLFQPDGFWKLLGALTHKKYFVTVETNGTFPRRDHKNGERYNREQVSWVADWKLPSAGLKITPSVANYDDLTENDFIKFVIENELDYQYARKAANQICYFNPLPKIAFSPMIEWKDGSPTYSGLDANAIIERVKRDTLDVIINVQLHKMLKIKEEN